MHFQAMPLASVLGWSRSGTGSDVTPHTKIVYPVLGYIFDSVIVKNITLSAEEHLIVAARQRAVAEHTTLNEQFRIWLSQYARKQEQLRHFDQTLDRLRGKLRVGRKLSRDQMNER